MRSAIRIGCLTGLLLCAGTSAAVARAQWTALGEFRTGGGSKAVQYSGRIDRCRIVCIEGSVVINALVMQAGGKKVTVTIAARLAPGEIREVPFPGGALDVTSLRFGDAGKGRYRIEVPRTSGESKAASTNEEASAWDLMELLLGGDDPTQTNAIGTLQQRAEQGDATAQHDLGMAYYRGDGVIQDYAESFRWFLEAARQGNAAAQTSVADLYRRGLGVEEDYSKALDWYRRAAAQKSAQAQLQLGIMYQNGWGVAPNQTEAATWLRQAAAQGNADAQNGLGNCYLKGEGVPPDARQAAAWYRKSAEGGYVWGQYNLGTMYYNGTGVPQDFAEAGRWYRLAAEEGNAEALCSLGLMNAEGHGIPKNPGVARQLYRQAAEKGLPRAQSYLGFLCLSGDGGATNLEEAVLWFQRAADSGWPAAMRARGELHLAGRGVAQDRTVAVGWLRKAADKGDERARQLLASLDSGSGAAPASQEKDAGPTFGDTMAATDKQPAAHGKPGTLRWKSKLAGGKFRELLGPAVGPNGAIYVPAGGGGATLEAFAADGRRQWRFEDERGALRASSTPLVGPEGTVYVCDLDRRINAIGANGTRRWSRQMGGVIGDAVLLDARSLAVALQGARNVEVLAADSGRTVRSYGWQEDLEFTDWLFVGRGGGLYASTREEEIVFRADGSRGNPPLLFLGPSRPAEAADGTVYYCDGGSVRLRRPDGTTGNFIPTSPGDEFHYTPAIGPGGSVYAAGRKGDDDSGVLVSLTPDLTLRWERRLRRPWDASPVVGSDGTVYVGSTDGTVHALDVHGRSLWEYQAEGAVGPIAISQDGTLYFGCVGESELYALWTGSPGPPGESGKTNETESAVEGGSVPSMPD